MASLRRPFAVVTALKQISQPTTTRAFHQLSPLKSSNIILKSRPTGPKITSFAKPQHAFRRSYQQPSAPLPVNTGSLSQRLLYGAGIFGGTLLAINLVFNRETREDGGMPPFERSYLNETFVHTGLGIGIIGIAASALHRSGWSVRIMATNPWLVIGGSLVLSIGTMYGCFATPPEK